MPITEKGSARPSSFSPASLSRLSCHLPNTPPPSVLTFLYKPLSLHTYTLIHNHGFKSLKSFGYVFPPNTAPRGANVVLGKMFGNKEMRLLMLGLDAAGKTSMQPNFSPVLPRSNDALTAILYKLKLNQSVTTIPTGASALWCT